MNGLWKWPGSGGKWFKIQYSSHFLMHNYNLNNTFLNSEFFKISQLPKHISTSNIQWPNALSQPITKISFHIIKTASFFLEWELAKLSVLLKTLFLYRFLCIFSKSTGPNQTVEIH
jgi:hypothetical protein